MEPKKLLSVETLEKKKNFSEKFGIILIPSIDKILEVFEAPKPRRPKM